MYHEILTTLASKTVLRGNLRYTGKKVYLPNLKEKNCSVLPTLSMLMWLNGIFFPFQVGKLKFHACRKIMLRKNLLYWTQTDLKTVIIVQLCRLVMALFLSKHN